MASKNIIVAKSKKNQSNINKAVEWGFKYDKANDLRDKADDNGDIKAFKAANRLCESSFDKHLDYMSEVPKTEQKRVENLIWGK